MSILHWITALLVSTSVMAGPVQDEDRDLTQLRAIGAPAVSTIYIFTSATCPHCAAFHQDILPDIIKQYVNTGKAQILFVDDPSTSITATAALLARCVDPEKSEQFMTEVFKGQKDWLGKKNARDILLKYAVNAGLTRIQANQCLGNTTVEAEMKQQWTNLARMYQVRAFPTVAVRQGNKVRTYKGANKRAMLGGMEHDFEQ